METTNFYFHLSQRGLDASNIEFRVETMVLNELYNEIDITKKFGFSQDCEHAQINNWYTKGALQRFQNFPQFLQLSENEKVQVLSGRKSTFQRKPPNILQEQMESAIYNLLSNSLHSLPLGLSNNSINRRPFFNNFQSRTTLSYLFTSQLYLYSACCKRLSELEKASLLVAYTRRKNEA